MLVSLPVNRTPEMDQNASAYNGSGATDSVDEYTLMFYHILWTILSPVVFALIIVVGTVGNALVIYVVMSRRKMQTPTNYLLTNLAISDLAFLIICVPITAYRFAAVTWPFGDVTCKVINYVIYVTTYVTVYTLMAVSLLRYVTVVHGLATARYRTKQNVIACNVLIWFLVLVTNIPTYMTYKLKMFDELFSYCGLKDGTTKPFFLTFFLFGYVLPVGVICALYIAIIHHLHSTSAANLPRNRNRTTRASKMIITVVIVFALLWLPLHINQLLSVFHGVPGGKLYEVFRVTSNCLAYGNSCANPIVYSFVSRDFRNSFRDVVCCRRKLTGRAETNGQTLENTAMI